MSEAQGMEIGATMVARNTTEGTQLDDVEKRTSGTMDSKKEAAPQGPANTASKRPWFKKAEKKSPSEEELQEAEKKKKAAEAATFGNYLVPTHYLFKSL